MSFEEEIHVVGKLEYLSVRITEFSVVIKDTIKRFHPHSINRSIKHNPKMLFFIPSSHTALLNNMRKNSILPIPLIIPIKLIQTNRFRVQNMLLYLKFFRFRLRNSIHSFLQDLQSRRFPLSSASQ